MKVAVCEAGYIEPDRDAGSRAVADLMAGLGELGHHARMFVELGHDIGADLAEFAPDVVIISRPGLFMRVYPLVQNFGVPIVYLAHDLHFVRVGLGEQLSGAGARAAGVLRTIEALCFERADLSVMPTDEEVVRAATEFPTARVASMNYFAMPAHDPPATPPPGLTLAFVGSAAHGPNRDGIPWFVTEVWPAVIARTPSARLKVCGVWPDDLQAHAQGVDYVGAVSDDQLDDLLRSARIGIAPLRFGAGMKRKTLHYLSLGLPTVGTGYSVEGLRSPGGETPGVLAAETASQWCEALEQLDDDDRWMRLSHAGTEFVRTRFSSERYLDGLAQMLASLR